MATTTETPASLRTNTLILPNGRKLGYEEYGDPNGTPIMYFHGWPSSRLEASTYHEPGLRLGARIISLDRPGIGLSTFSPKFKIARWPNYVKTLADALGIDKFAVMGVSSGAPYAYACARFIPERLIATAVVSGVGPLDIPKPEQYVLKEELQAIWLARHMPWVARPMFSFLFSRMIRDPEKARKGMLEGLPESDREVMDRPDMMDKMGIAMREMMRNGTRGAVQTIALEGQPWGFTLEEISFKVHVFHGGADSMAFPPTAQYVTRRLPNSELHLYPDDGHIAVLVNRADDVIRALQP